MQRTYRNKKPQKNSPLDLIAFCYLHTQNEYFKMRKISASDGDGDETVHSELFRVGYATAYDEVALPNYLVHLPSQNGVIVEIGIGD